MTAYAARRHPDLTLTSVVFNISTDTTVEIKYLLGLVLNQVIFLTQQSTLVV